MAAMVFKPARDYPTSYEHSVSEIELVCDCHKCIISGSARRTGLTVTEEYPVYRIVSRIHPELNDVRIALSPVGFLNPIKLLKEARV